MRNITLIVVVLVSFVCLLLTACPSSTPKNPKELEPRVEQGNPPEQGSPVVTEPVVTSPVEGEPAVLPVSPEGTVGSTGEGENPMTKSIGIPEDIFGHYTTWPPAKITTEELELLKHAVVVFETTKGIIKIRVFPDEAPIHSANFVKLTQEGFFDGLTFHRVVRDFMSQGGDPLGTGEGGPEPEYTLPAEIKLPHKAGSVAAARVGDEWNPERRSSGSQFYMVHTDMSCKRLDGQYTVFGQIIEGLDVNLSLSVNSTGPASIPGAPTDKIIRAWVEAG